VQALFLPETVQVQFLTLIILLQSEREGYLTMKRTYSKQKGVVKNHRQFSLMLITTQYKMVSIE
jgi:hypothetical protein